MPLKLYNTLTLKKELFKEIKKGKVKFYFCGPTVYNYVHLGNLRAYIVADLVRRYLKYKGYDVFEVMNITDVEDKIIKSIKKSKQSLQEFTRFYETAFLEDLQTLNIEIPEVIPRATEHIQEMIDIIKKLEKNGLAYKSDDSSVYFSISKFKKYGSLAHLDISKLKQNAQGRLKEDEYEKEDARDFVLWKAYDKEDGNVVWKTEIGNGRPGWHIECSAMSMKYLGNHFDIHAGGVDLIFPHHENEIAQSEASTNKKFVNYWFHNEHLLVDGHKMSKSLGNFYTLRDLLNKGYNPKAIRYLLLSQNYRVQLNFTEEAIKASENAVQRLNDFVLRLKEIKNESNYVLLHDPIGMVKSKFEDSMNNDLAISRALSHVFDFITEMNSLIMENKLGKKDAEKIIELMRDFNKVLAVIDFEEEKLSPKLKKLIDEREKARKEKDFEKADKIREDLKKKGIILEDTKEGVRWKKV